MYLPHSYHIALLFMVGSMLCWGSWANTMKLCPRYRFQLFYWDYIVGLILGSLLFGITLGSSGNDGVTFLSGLQHAPAASIQYALLSGVLFNVANLLLVAAIEIAGMAVAFPIGIGLALVIGALSSYILAPQGSPLFLFGGIALVVVAIVCDSLAYRAREAGRPTTARGIILSLVAGLLMGSFYPFASRAMSVPGTPGPYVVGFFFVLGVALCALPMNFILMKKPIDGGSPVSMSGYASAPFGWHIAGVLGGLIWVAGATLNFAASRVNFVGPAISYSIGQGATMVSAAWGVFIWREFASPTSRMRNLLTAMFVCFVAGLCSIAAAPLIGR